MMNVSTGNNQDNAFLNNDPEESSFDLRRYLLIFMQRWKLFLLVFIVFLLAYAVTQRHRTYSPKYQATFDLGIAKEQQVDGYISQLQKTDLFPNSSSAQRVISNLLSVTIARKIVDSLALFISDRDLVADFYVATRLKSDFESPIGPFHLVFENNRVTVSNKEGAAIAAGTAGEYLDLGPLDLALTSRLDSPAKKSYSVTFFSPKRTAFALRNSLSLKILGTDKIDKGIGATGIPYSGESVVSNFINDKTMQSGLASLGILRISVFWGSPREALAISQVLSDLIIKRDLTEKSLQFIQSRDFIETQLILYKEKLAQLEDNVTRYKKLKKIVNLDASTQARIMQISAIESRISQLEIEEAVLNNLTRFLTADPGTGLPRTDSTLHFAPTLIASPGFQDLYSSFLRSDADLKSKLREYSPGHPKVMETQARLAGLQDQLRAEAAKRLVTLKSEIGSVRSENNTLQEKLEDVPADEIQLARMERDRKITEQLYTFFREKLEDIRVREAGVTTDLKIINPSIASSNPVNPPKRLSQILIALLVALILGWSALFIAEYFDTSVRYLDPVSNRLNLPLFAAVPAFSGSGKKLLFFKDSERSKSSTGITIGSPEFEAFRKLTFNLDVAFQGKKHRTVLITSACPEDGKTFITLNLGTVLSTIGKKVVLVDTDFRKEDGSLSEITAQKNGPGLFEVLEGKTALKDAIIKLPDYKFDIIPTGALPPNPFLYLESEPMRVFLDTLKNEYDYVLIDGLPVLLFADAPYMAIACDGVLISCRYGRTSFKEIEDTQALLSAPGIKLAGLVLNGVPLTQNSYYYHHYYKYYKKYHKNAA